MNEVKETDIREFFTYRSCTANQIAHMERWRDALASVAVDFTAHTPMSGDVIVALRGLKAAMMAMNAALVAPMPK